MTTTTRIPTLHRELLPGTIRHAAALPFYRDRWQGIDLEAIAQEITTILRPN